MSKFLFGLAIMVAVALLFTFSIADSAWAKAILYVLGVGVASLAAVFGFTTACDGFKEVWRR